MAKKHRRKDKEQAHEESTSSSLERTLTNLDVQAEGFEIDLDLGAEYGLPVNVTPVDFKVGKALVPVNEGSRSSKRKPARHLAKMTDLEVLDAERLLSKRIIHPGMGDYSLMNSFREIRTRLLRKSENKNFVLVVVSIGPNMGATFTTANLGAAFSYEGEKTALLIDCYPKKENLSALLGVDQALGLSDYIKNSSMEPEAVIHPTGIKRMRLIPCGSSTDKGLEFLTSERMREFLGVLKRRHEDRFIFVNAPPLEASADALILSESADYILIVVPYGRISKNRLERAIKSLPREKIAGVVMNNCKKYV